MSCKNCGHELWRLSDGTWEHYTRFYKPTGYPYSTKRCYVNHKTNVLPHDEGCSCENPEPDNFTLKFIKSSQNNSTVMHNE